jgi:hypothetical protein
VKRFFYGILACLLLTMAIPAMASASSSSTLINIAHGYIGSPYSYGGTSSAGFDCSGFTQRVFIDGGSSLPRTTSGQFNVGASVSKDNLQPGDLVFFNTNGIGVSHVGIYIGSNNFIHASSSRGVMISSIYDPHYWGSRYIGARRPNAQPVANPKAEETTEVTTEEKVETKPEEPKAEVKKEVKQTTNPVVTQNTAEKPKVENPAVAKPKAVAQQIAPQIAPPPPVLVTKPEDVESEEAVENPIVESDELIARIEYTHLHPTAQGLQFTQMVWVEDRDLVLLEKVL